MSKKSKIYELPVLNSRQTTTPGIRAMGIWRNRALALELNRCRTYQKVLEYQGRVTYKKGRHLLQLGIPKEAYLVDTNGDPIPETKPYCDPEMIRWLSFEASPGTVRQPSVEAVARATRRCACCLSFPDQGGADILPRLTEYAVVLNEYPVVQ